MPSNGDMPSMTPHFMGEKTTFIWKSRVKEDKPPLLLGDFNDWDEQNPISMEETSPGVWSYTTEFPRGAYIEYVYTQDGQRLLDPSNPRLIFNGLGGNNNFFFMPPGAPTPFADPPDPQHRGKILHQVARNDWLVIGRKREVLLYDPVPAGPHPLIVVLDGMDYYRRSSLVSLVDNLITAGRIRPVALAMVANGEEARGVEYSCNDATLGFLTETVLPLAHQHLDLLDLDKNPGAYGILGASLGGLMALYAGLRRPKIFGRVLSQSGAFFPDFVVDELVRKYDGPPLRLWLDVGLYEFLLDENRKMRDLLQQKGFDFTYREYPGGHNHTAWRDDVWRGLKRLFGVDLL